ncbi:MAG TPA: YfiR family protein [Candidatus Eisenbacteria bacterium]|nr:YfiR family protein [Candidatus Eisenbacteria bacterium]
MNATKAEMVWNIAKFIQWPDTALATSNGQLVFTILGEDDLAASLATLLSSKLVNGKPVFVRFARRAQDARGSQILYVAASEQAHVDEVLGAVAGEPVLTVANAPGFAARGGMVGFAPGGDRVRFEINLGHAEKSGLRISAKLLALARVVDQTP